MHLEGLDATVGIASNIDVPCERDAALVRLLRRLGAVPFCRTNLSQTCCSFDSCNPIFGATRNPRDPKRSPGGSSGGEAALIANGGSVMGFGENTLSPISNVFLGSVCTFIMCSTGTDLGGSVRMPANFCGITSLKPTAGRLPLSGQESDGGLVNAVEKISLNQKMSFFSRRVSLACTTLWASCAGAPAPHQTA